jgi:hypothetical protein
MKLSHKNKLLVARHDKGEEGSVPEQLPVAFLEDCIHYTRMAYSEGVACAVHGQLFQDEMAQRWPAQWMLWMFTQTRVTHYAKDD